MKRVLLLIVALGQFLTASGQTAIGKWRDCLDYSRVQHVAATPDGIYAAGRGGLFRYDPDDNTLKIISRATGLSDVGIATMAYGDGSLVIGYTNSNIDILQKGSIYNISDIKRSSISGDRDIYGIRFHSGMAYLCTGFGVVAVDLSRHEIKETYYIGAAGSYTAVYDLAFTVDSIYAATAEGLKRISISEQHLGISDRWQADNRLDSVTVTKLHVTDGVLLAAGYKFDPNTYYLYRLADNSFSMVAHGEIRSMQTNAGRFTLCIDDMVKTYQADLSSLLNTHTTYTWGSIAALDAVYDSEGTLWVGHSWDGLIGIHQNGTEDIIKPAGPSNNDNVFRLVPLDGQMMLCPGATDGTYTARYINANLLTTDGRNWTSLDKSNGMLAGKYDVVDVTSDGKDLYAATYGSGLLRIQGNQVVEAYDQSNTNGALQTFSSGTWTTLIVGGVAYDRSTGNLWMLNSRSPRPLVLHNGSTWKSFNTESMTGTVPEVNKILFDTVNHYVWFAGRTNQIYVHDGINRMSHIDANHGSRLQTEAINAMVQDREGNIWIGTNKGIKVIYDGYRAFANGGGGEQASISCNNITITNGSFAEYLMAYENITCIAVDGANRKWVGTASGGLYLLSAGGLDQLQHFTAANSPLFSDQIICIGIMPATGDVYIGTDHGLQVYRSTATYAEPYTAETVYAYPNPVRPGYDGPIAIKGFARDAIVHITDASGHTVYSAQAFGGQAIWNGRTQSGKPVASGTYYVFASDSDAQNRAVAKILIIR